MKQLITALLLALTCSTQAQTTPKFTPPTKPQIEAMLKECEKQMERGVCTVQVDEKSYPPNTPDPLISGYGRVPLIAYVRLQNQQGFMCPYAEMWCTKDPKSDVCKVAMALWNPVP
jgi:hypothetical protein